MHLASIFMNGRSQAIRLPKEYRFAEGIKQVRVRRLGAAVILEPLEKRDWDPMYWDAVSRIQASPMKEVIEPVGLALTALNPEDL